MVQGGRGSEFLVRSKGRTVKGDMKRATGFNYLVPINRHRDSRGV